MRQKSVVFSLRMARLIFPSPALYPAHARYQSPWNLALRSFRYFAAATVALSGSRRSSTQKSVSSP